MARELMQPGTEPSRRKKKTGLTLKVWPFNGENDGKMMGK